jgi:hypothetical protein
LITPIHFVSGLESQNGLVITDPNPIECVDPVQVKGDDFLEALDHEAVCEPIYGLVCGRIVLDFVPMSDQLRAEREHQN